MKLLIDRAVNRLRSCGWLGCEVKLLIDFVLAYCLGGGVVFMLRHISILCPGGF